MNLEDIKVKVTSCSDNPMSLDFSIEWSIGDKRIEEDRHYDVDTIHLLDFVRLIEGGLKKIPAFIELEEKRKLIKSLVGKEMTKKDLEDLKARLQSQGK